MLSKLLGHHLFLFPLQYSNHLERWAVCFLVSRNLCHLLFRLFRFWVDLMIIWQAIFDFTLLSVSVNKLMLGKTFGKMDSCFWQLTRLQSDSVFWFSMFKLTCCSWLTTISVTVLCFSRLLKVAMLRHIILSTNIQIYIFFFLITFNLLYYIHNNDTLHIKEEN